MITFFKKLFEKNSTLKKPIPDPDFPAIINEIKEKESSVEIIPGKKIHEFKYNLFTLRLDQDVTENCRITVNRGNERVYSFTVFASPRAYKKIEQAYRDVIDFLKSERNISELPDSDQIKGFYYGQ